MKRVCIAAIASVFATSCTPYQTVMESNEIPFSLEIDDVASEQAFLISIKSQASAPLCIAREGWPDNKGRVSEIFEVALLHKDGELKADGFHPPQCIGGCEPIVVAPFGRVNAKISYANFGDPAKIANLPQKILKADVFAHTCTPDDFPKE